MSRTSSAHAKHGNCATRSTPMNLDSKARRARRLAADVIISSRGCRGMICKSIICQRALETQAKWGRSEYAAHFSGSDSIQLQEGKRMTIKKHDPKGLYPK